MIRYPVTLDTLKALIANEDRRWFKDAQLRTRRFKRLGRYSEKKGIWSRIKRVYIQLQHWKCIYCEKRLAAPRHGKIEHDVEHFRPKSSIKAWPPVAGTSIRRKLQFDFPGGNPNKTGYYLLAYHPLNYCTSCKSCNSFYKKDYFPVAGRRRLRGSNPSVMKSEKPLLIYPLGDIDDNPERLFHFVGLNPQPWAKKGTHGYNRAEVTIKFFELDLREDLLIERAERIVALWHAMIIADQGSAAQKRATRDTIAGMMKRSSEHVNCVKSFYLLARKNPQQAKELYTRIQTYLREQG